MICELTSQGKTLIMNLDDGLIGFIYSVFCESVLRPER